MLIHTFGTESHDEMVRIYLMFLHQPSTDLIDSIREMTKLRADLVLVSKYYMDWRGQISV